MATHEETKMAERIAFRLTGGGQRKVFIEDTKQLHGGWIDWQELAQMIAEELADED